MTTATEKHLDSWLEHQVRDEDLSLVKEMMMDKFNDDPEFYEDKGWQRLFQDSGAYLYQNYTDVSFA